MRMKGFVFLAAIAIFASPTWAGGIFGSEGNNRCGLGTMIFGNNQSISSQTLEVSSDELFLNESFSVTTGTSGCSHSGIVKNMDPRAVMYANANLEELKVEMASGSGETLRGFAALMGCGDTDIPLFMSASKRHYREIYNSPATGADEMLTNLHNGLQTEPRLARHCKSLGT